jgi:putative transposase
VWDIKYHLVWITKYRYKVLRGEVAERARDLLREICAAREVRIVRGAVSPDHIHMLVIAPPQLAPAKLVQFLKGRSSRMLATGLPTSAEAVLGPTLVGTRVFLRDGGRGR